VRPLGLALADGDRTRLPAGVSVADCFDESLLLLGVAGAGKTTLPRELAQPLVSQAEQDPDHPVRW
jgi:tRNA A37 threonylcarbamoyladenosine biosynthesis protein TsaE